MASRPTDTGQRIAAMTQAERSGLSDHEELTPGEASVFLGVSVSFLNRRRTEGGGPVYTKVHAHRVTYQVGDLRAFRERRRAENTSQRIAA
jgi:hypothetical protein